MKNFRINYLVLAVITVGVFPQVSFGHARFVLNGTTPPRNTSTGLKTGPCGGIARTATPTILKAGQQLEVQWEETVDHPGYYRIAFSPSGDMGFDQNVLVQKVDDIANVHSYKATITVPNTPCTQCTLQMIQYMTENVPPSLYYSCADIEIRTVVPSPSPRPSTSPSVSPRPIPLPSGDCH